MKVWKQIKLGDAATFHNGYAFKPSDWSTSGKEIIRIQNLTKGSSQTNYFKGELPNKYRVSNGDILISWSGSLGVYEWQKGDAWLNQHLFKVVFDKEEIDKSFFKHLMNISIEKLETQVHGATMKHITKKNFDDFIIPLPPLDQQKKIANILDAADAYRQKTKALISKYDELTQSLFLDMFGDPVKNEKGWEIDSLKNHGNFKNGLNYSKSEKGVKVKCLGVGDFKSLYRIESIENLSELNLTQLPSNDFLLKNGDLVFVRSNGNKELVGRCLAVYPNDLKLTFSGFCIRYRIESLKLTSDYLAHLFRTKTFKNSMLEEGRGANIQNINQQILANLKIPLPKTNLQTEFAERVQAIEQQKAKAQASLEKSEELFNSLLQKAFNGELV